MKAALAFACVLALAGCKSKKDDAPAGSNAPATGSGSAVALLVTKDQAGAVGAQGTRLDELATLLDKADVLSGPVALIGAIAKLPEWSQLTAKVPKLMALDDVASAANLALTQLHDLRAGLREASQRLGNLQKELYAAIDSPAAQQLVALKKTVSDDLRNALAPLASQVAGVVDKVLGPLAAKLDDAADLVIGACAMAKISGAGKGLVELCANAKQTFAQATAFLADIKAKPTALYAEVSAKLEAQLGELVDEGTKKALDAAQAQIDAALKLPPASGSGSAGAGSAGSAAAGSGSAGSGSAP